MMTPRDPYVVAMEAVVPPHAQARDDYTILSNIGNRLDVEQSFTEGRSCEDWLRWLYDESRERAATFDITLPDYEEFSAKGWHYIDPTQPGSGALAEYRRAPEAAPLRTPSRRIEICSRNIMGFGSIDVLPHPAWYPPTEWLGNATGPHTFHLISGQPAEKLHSQLDHGPESRAAKAMGRTPVDLNPSDAKALGIVDGDLLRVFNDRGACLASARLDVSIRQGCLAMSTGAWLDTERQADGTLICRNGNPNTLTRDQGTSELAQGPTAHSCLVGIEKFLGQTGPTKAYSPPEIERGKAGKT
jgi:biotin/methionine sulfoxide reductase